VNRTGFTFWLICALLCIAGWSYPYLAHWENTDTGYGIMMLFPTIPAVLMPEIALLRALEAWRSKPRIFRVTNGDAVKYELCSLNLVDIDAYGGTTDGWVVIGTYDTLAEARAKRDAMKTKCEEVQ